MVGSRGGRKGGIVRGGIEEEGVEDFLVRSKAAGFEGS